jgi:hypothetical protein
VKLTSVTQVNEAPDKVTPSGTAYISALSQEIVQPNQSFVLSVSDLQHVSAVLVPVGRSANSPAQHVRAKYPDTSTQAQTAQAQPPVQQPPAQVQKTPVPTVSALLYFVY